MPGLGSVSIATAVAALLSGLLSLSISVLRQRSDKREGRVPKRSDRLTFWIDCVLLAATAGALV